MQQASNVAWRKYLVYSQNEHNTQPPYTRRKLARAPIEKLYGCTYIECQKNVPRSDIREEGCSRWMVAVLRCKWNQDGSRLKKGRVANWWQCVECYDSPKKGYCCLVTVWRKWLVVESKWISTAKSQQIFDFCPHSSFFTTPRNAMDRCSTLFNVFINIV